MESMLDKEKIEEELELLLDEISENHVQKKSSTYIGSFVLWARGAFSRLSNTKFFRFLTSPTIQLVVGIACAIPCIFFPPAGILALGIASCITFVALSSFDFVLQIARFHQNKKLMQKDKLVEELLMKVNTINPELLDGIRTQIQKILDNRSNQGIISRANNYIRSVAKGSNTSYIASFVFCSIALILQLNPINIGLAFLYGSLSALSTAHSIKSEIQYRKEKNHFLDVYEVREKGLLLNLGLDNNIIRNLKLRDLIEIKEYTEEAIRLTRKVSDGSKDIKEALGELQNYKPNPSRGDIKFLSTAQTIFGVGLGGDTRAEDIINSPRNKITEDTEKRCEQIVSVAISQMKSGEMADIENLRAKVYKSLFDESERYLGKTEKVLPCLSGARVQDRFQEIREMRLRSPNIAEQTESIVLRKRLKIEPRTGGLHTEYTEKKPGGIAAKAG